jgi:hypothetical protein
MNRGDAEDAEIEGEDAVKGIVRSLSRYSGRG